MAVNREMSQYYSRDAAYGSLTILERPAEPQGSERTLEHRKRTVPKEIKPKWKVFDYNREASAPESAPEIRWGEPSFAGEVAASKPNAPSTNNPRNLHLTSAARRRPKNGKQPTHSKQVEQTPAQQPQAPQQPSQETPRPLQDLPANSKKKNYRERRGRGKMTAVKDMTASDGKRAPRSEYIPPHLRPKGKSLESSEKADRDKRAAPSNKHAKLMPLGGGVALPLSPPSSSSNKTVQPAVQETVWGQPDWDTSVPVENHDHGGPYARPSKWSSNQSRGPRKPYKKTVWPKNKDMKARPRDEQSDGGITFKSNSAGDPDYDVRKLMAWNGDWLPPPEDWACRKEFTDRHPMQGIEKWAKGVTAAYGGPNANGCEDYGGVDILSGPYAELFRAEQNGDLVLRQWIPKQMEGENLQQFWRGLRSRAPAPLSDVDLTEAQPWWDLYQGEDHCMTKPLKAPETFLDRMDEEFHHAGRTAAHALAGRAQHETKKKQKHQAMKTQTMTQVMPPPEVYVSENCLKPKANIYVRSVNIATDIGQMTTLYNHYVKNTVHAPEFQPRKESDIRNRVNEVVNIDSLQWIVAVHRGNIRGSGRQQDFGEENIVGFAHLNDFHDEGSMYRYTFDLEIYVHHEYLRQGIGSCLIDHMLSLADPMYVSRGGYEYGKAPTGHGKVVKKINFGYRYDADNTEEAELVCRVFNKMFKFRKAGHLKEVGVKLKHWVDLAIYQYTTGEPIDLAVGPSIPL